MSTRPGGRAGSALVRAGQASLGQGQLSASRSWFDAAYRAAVREDDVSSMAAAVLGLGGVWVHEHRTAAGGGMLRARLRHVLSRVDPASPLGLRLRVRLAGEADYASGGHAEVLAALEEVRRGPDPVVHAEALSLAHHCLLGPDHGARRRELAEELVGESFRTGRPVDLLMGLLWQTVDLFLGAEPHAERRLNELRAVLDLDENLAVRYVVSAMDVMLTLRAGRLEEAEALAQACAGRGAAAGDADTTGWYGGQLVAIRWYQGRLPELLPLLERMVHSPDLSAIDNSFYAALAVAAALCGDRRRAAGALATLRGRDLGDLPRSSSWLATMHGVAEAAHLIGDAELAARAYQLLRPYAHLPVMVSLGVACFGSVHHALGVAAMTAGEPDLAIEHLEAAIHRNLAMGHWPAAAMSRLRYARALDLRGTPQDVAAAQRERATAAHESDALGMDQVAVNTPAAGGTPAECARQGRRWRVARGGRAVLVGHAVGMLHLAVLLSNPGHEIPAADLAAGVDALGQDPGWAGRSMAQPVADHTAIGQYRARLAALLAEADALEAGGDHERAARIRAERDWLVKELTGAAGLRGRTRRFADNAERARIAVGKAIRRAIDAIDRVDPVIGAHLRDSVHTGLRCVYRPA